MFMKCIFCKANIDDNASVCPYCDSSLVTNVGTTSTVESVVEQPTPAVQTPVVEQVVQTPVVETPVQPVQTPVVVTPVQPVVQPVQTPVQVVSPTLETPPNVEMVTPKKKKPILLIIIILLVIGVVVFAGIKIYSNINLSKGEQPNTEHEITDPGTVEVNENRIKSDRVIMLYVIGSDLESRDGAATKDINEIMTSNFNQEDIDIIAYVGGTKYWQNKEFNENENAIYEITNNEVKKLKTYDKKHMNKGSTLTEYLNYVYANYESDKYSLILWDHGGGPLNGYGVD